MKLVNMMDAEGRGAIELKKEIIEHLEGEKGYVILKNLNHQNVGLEDSIKWFTDFCSNIGQLQFHEGSEYVWHIKAKKSQSKVFTFSEHNDEAPFHTDSQYRLYPENYQALYVIKKAECGGGLTSLITIKSIYKVLEACQHGAELKHIFTNIELPFAVPTIFKQEKDNDKEVIFGKVLEEGKIRYRYDTLIKGLEFVPGILSDKQIKMIGEFEKLVNEDIETESYMLENGEMVVLNNKKVLHKRSGFSDLERHLLRIRFDPFEQ